MKMRVLTTGLILMLSGTAWAQGGAAQPAAPAKETQPEKKKEEVKPLKVGDKAPALSVEKWIKGEPITGFEKGKVYVVEFWARWCGPCIMAFPHLSELQKEYKDKGVVIIGTNIWEDKRGESYTDATLPQVKEFVEKQGDKMGYTVAYDGPTRAMDKNFMKASGRNGIPSAFIVNQEGVVAWMGHPAAMDEPLEKIVAGTYDIKAAAEEEKKLQERQAAEMKEMEGINKALQSQDYKQAVKLIDERLATKPQNAKQLSFLKFRLLAEALSDFEQAFAWAPTAAQSMTAKEDAMMVNSMAWLMIDGPGASKGDPKVALKLANQASELAGNKDGMILDTVALAQFKTGDVAKAIETQKKAIEAVKGHPDADETTLNEMKARLEEFEKTAKEKK